MSNKKLDRKILAVGGCCVATVDPSHVVAVVAAVQVAQLPMALEEPFSLECNLPRGPALGLVHPTCPI